MFAIVALSCLAAAPLAALAAEFCFRLGRSSERERIAYMLAGADLPVDPYKVADAVGIPQPLVASMYPSAGNAAK